MPTIWVNDRAKEILEKYKKGDGESYTDAVIRLDERTQTIEEHGDTQ